MTQTMLILFLKAHVKGHARHLAGGKTVFVRPYESKVQKRPDAPSISRAKSDARTGDLFGDMETQPRAALPSQTKTSAKYTDHELNMKREMMADTLSTLRDEQYYRRRASIHAGRRPNHELDNAIKDAETALAVFDAAHPEVIERARAAATARAAELTASAMRA